MRYAWNWIRDNAGTVTGIIAILGGFAVIVQLIVVMPMQQGFAAVHQRLDALDELIKQHFDAQDKRLNQRFDDQNVSLNQRFDAQDTRIEDLVRDVSALNQLSDRVSRSETRLDALTEQAQTADAPPPSN